MKKKYTMPIFFAISLLHYLAANFVHPITPTIITNLNLHDYMFGVAFAAMSFTNFLFSPFWGKMRDFFSAKMLLFIGNLGYAFGQFLFSIMETEPTILVARCVSGFFVGAISVSALIYVVEMSEGEKTGENLAIFAIIQALGAAFGYLIGGTVGVYSIKVTFTFQSLTLVLCGILFFVLLEDNSTGKSEPLNAKALIKEINPLKSFMDCRKFMTKSLAILFIIVTVANFGTYAFDQNFNYYLKDQFNFTSIYNGAFKAIIGIITLVVNSTLYIWIVRRTNIKKATCIIFVSCAVSIAIMLAVNSIVLTIAFSLLFYSFNAVNPPLLQDSVTRKANSSNYNMVMGFYNATKSLGMICGALIAGLIYDYGAKLPFALAGICFVLAAIFTVVNKSTEKSVK